MAIVDYFDKLKLSVSGYEIFRRYYSEGGAIKVHLDADGKVAELNPDSEEPQYEGNTPRFTGTNRYDIYLGSQVGPATITHEFFHQLDRYFGNRLSSPNDPAGLPQFLVQAGLFMNPDLLLGRANRSDDYAEIFADFGMTAVLDMSGIRRAEPGVLKDESENELIGWNYTQYPDNAAAAANAMKAFFIQLFTSR